MYFPLGAAEGFPRDVGAGDSLRFVSKKEYGIILYVIGLRNADPACVGDGKQYEEECQDP